MAEAAPDAAAAPAQAMASKPKKSGVSDLIVEIVAAYKGRRGISAAAIKKALQAKGYDVEMGRSHVINSLHRLVVMGVLIQTRGSGASGSYRMNRTTAKTGGKPKTKTEAAREPAAAKKAPKKSPKKPPAAEKAAKPKIKKEPK